jgi:hypothetical protein
MLNVLSRKSRTLARQIAANGVTHVAKMTLDRALIFTLSRIYGFTASWHPPTSTRPYRIVVADLVNSLQPDVVCEVGCGLGSILSRIHAPRRLGFDIDPAVIKAAKLLRGRRIEFHQGGLAEVSLPQMDVLMLVNWIHEISPADLALQLVPLLGRTHYLVLDAIDASNDFGYRYKHDFSFLDGKARKISTVRHPSEGRSFQLFEVLPP